jgi:hypothetical protein
LLEFLQAVGTLPEKAPRKLVPPMPDLECNIAGERRLFELGEVLESQLAEGLAHSLKQSRLKAEALRRGDIDKAASIRTIGGRRYAAHACLERILREKLGRPYQSEGARIELLLFYDRQEPWGPFDYMLGWECELADLLTASVFKTVWLFSLPTQAVIGSLRRRTCGMQTTFDWTFHFDPSAAFEAMIPGGGEGPDEIGLFTPVLVPRKRG